MLLCSTVSHACPMQDILDSNNWTLAMLYERYDLVLHMESCAFDTPFYSTGKVIG